MKWGAPGRSLAVGIFRLSQKKNILMGCNHSRITTSNADVATSDPSFARSLAGRPRRRLKALLRAARAERDRRSSGRKSRRRGPQQQGKRADDLYLEKLRLQLELERYKKWYYGPRADRLSRRGELGQALLNFGEELARHRPPGGGSRRDCARATGAG